MMFKHIKTLLWVALVVFAVYSGIQFVMPQYRYYAFKTDAADIVRFRYRPPNDLKKLRTKLYEKVEEVGLPVSENHIEVERTERGYWARIKWQETVDILGQYQKTYHFEVEVSR
jgi:hypothetical protein